MATERHDGWNSNIYNWILVRDSLSGESKVKKANEKYLPMPAAMALSTAKSPINNPKFDSNDPNYHTNLPYSAYKSRARFPEFPSYIQRGLVGLVIQKQPKVELPFELEYLLNKFSKDGMTIFEYYEFLVAEAISMGRVGILVDVDSGLEDKKPYAVTYPAESILDWSRKLDADGSYVVLEEYDSTTESEKTIRLSVDGGVYNYQKFEKGVAASLDSPVIYMGNFISSIPLTIIGATDIGVDVGVSPLVGICRTALQVYQMDADLRHGEYMSCNPTLTITGVDNEIAPSATGSGVCLILPQGANVFYPTTDTSALSHVKSRIDSLQLGAMEQSASLLGSGGKESGEALRIRQSANTATLISIAKSVAKGMRKVLTDIALFHSIDQTKIDDIVFAPNTDFVTSLLDPAQQKELRENMIAGLMSKETVIDNMRKAGLLQDGDSVSDELERIDTQEPI